MGFQHKDDANWLSLFRQHMDEMSGYIFRMKGEWGGRYEFAPLIDIYESGDRFVIEIELPGFDEQDFTVSATGSALRIEGLKREERPEVTGYICLERHFGRFSRTLDIPPAFDPATAQAIYKRGVLTISVGRKNI